MAAAIIDEELFLISKGLYRTVSDVIGPECIVRLRRQGLQIYDCFVSCDSSNPLMHITGGSKAEGFSLKSSDMDIMTVDSKTIVINSCHVTCKTNYSSVLLAETGNVPPGFALLKCLKYDPGNASLHNSLVPRGHDLYISSHKARLTNLCGENSFIHGPCGSSVVLGLDCDFAYTLRCPYWPEQALSFFHRSKLHGWPSYKILTEICNDGYLFVPIDSKQQRSRDEAELEWRMSFSLAEKKIVHSMNHCQFLCYGLMRVLLNEVLKKFPGTGDLLCSYYMKTAVFWEVQENPNGWTSKNFILKFWNVFRRVIKWVSIGYCPGFFIPEYNVFNGKIFGRQQIELLLQLSSLYEKGFNCLLHCSPLHNKLSLIINRPILATILAIEEKDYVPLTAIDKRKIEIDLMSCSVTLPTDDPVAMARTLFETIALQSTKCEFGSAIRLRINYILQIIAVTLLSTSATTYENGTSNKRRYRNMISAQSMLKKTKCLLYMGEMHLASSLYINGKYHKVISIVHDIKHRLQSQPYMYEWNLNDDDIKRCRQQRMTYESIVKRLIIGEYDCDMRISIEELIPESTSRKNIIGTDLLFIPPLVYLNFLLVLCYTRLNETHKRNEVICELHSLVCYDNGHHIKVTQKPISWEILGICQQMCGDADSAMQSYLYALNDANNEFKSATEARINKLFNTL